MYRCGMPAWASSRWRHELGDGARRARVALLARRHCRVWPAASFRLDAWERRGRGLPHMRDEDTVARFVNEQCHVAAGGRSLL